MIGSALGAISAASKLKKKKDAKPAKAKAKAKATKAKAKKRASVNSELKKVKKKPNSRGMYNSTRK